MATQLVRDWMTPNPTTITADITLEAAMRLMEEGNIRHLPVISGSRLVSLITKSDIRRAELVIAASYNRREMKDIVTRLKTISEIMTYRPRTIDVDAPVSEVASILLENHLSALPVMKDGQLVGIITESDLFRMVLEQTVAE